MNMRTGRNHSLLLALAITMVAVMVTQPIAVGFASSSSYTATTVSTGNSISSEYYTLRLLSYSGSSTSKVLQLNNDFTDIDGEQAFSNGQINYSYDNSDNTYNIVNGNTTLSKSNIFVAIGNVVGNISGTYGLSCTCTGFESYSSSSVTMTWGNNNENLSTGYAYRVNLSASNLNYSSTVSPNNTSICIAITATNVCNATYVNDHNTSRFSATVEALEQHLEDSNTDLSGYNFDANSDDGITGISIEREGSTNHSIAESSGQSAIDLAVTIPSNIYFYVYVTIKAPTLYVMQGHESFVRVAIQKIWNADQSLAEDLGYVDLRISDGLFPQDVNSKICINPYAAENESNLIERARNYNVSIGECICCDEGQSLKINFTGQQGQNNVFGINGTEMVVTAKIVQFGS